jgi:hypothetical protein
MEVTQERLDGLLEAMKQVAKTNRELVGFKGQFSPVAIVVGPHGERAVQPMRYRSYEEKKLLMTALSIAARKTNALAILLVNDTFHAKTEEFSKHFGIPEGLSWDQWEDAYSDVLETQLGGSLANAPKHLLTDALVLTMKGPILKPQVFVLPYHEGVGDSIRWDAEMPEHDAEILMLDDWWDKSPVN